MNSKIEFLEKLVEIFEDFNITLRSDYGVSFQFGAHDGDQIDIDGSDIEASHVEEKLEEEREDK